MNGSLNEQVHQRNVFALHPLCQVQKRLPGDLPGQTDAALHARTAQALVFGNDGDQLHAGRVDHVVDVEHLSAADVAARGPVDDQAAAFDALLFQRLTG